MTVNVEHKTNRDFWPTSLPIDHKSRIQKAKTSQTKAKSETKNRRKNENISVYTAWIA